MSEDNTTLEGKKPEIGLKGKFSVEQNQHV